MHLQSESTVAPRFATPLHCRHSTAFNGFLLDWSPPATLCVNPPCHLLPQVLEKLRTSRAKGILIYPYWPLQSWFQEVHRLSSFHFRLPPPRLSVRSHHPGIVEPFVNREVQLRAVSGLRLCVKDGLLQACVLFATQGDNSISTGSLTSTQISTGSLTSTLRLYLRIRASSPSGCCSSWWSSTFQPLQELNGPDILYVELAPLQRTPSASPLLSSWLGAYGSLLLQSSSTSMFLCGRLLSLSSSSSTCLRASIFLKRHSFDKLLQLL